MVDIQSASLSDPGGRRRNNEDYPAFFEPTEAEELRHSGCLYIVADGVGGAARGELASKFAARKVLYEYYQQIDLEPGERLRRIIERVNEDIHSFAEEHNTRMATTIVTAVVRGGLLYLANVGDSRAYLIREGQASQLNRDHSIVGEMVAHGEMTEADAMTSKVKNRLTRSLGGESEVHVDVYPPLALQAGDKILLCSDGLTRYALSEDIARMTRNGSPEEVAKGLIRFANGRGGADNISVVVAEYQASEMLAPIVHVPRPTKIDDLEETYHTMPDLKLRRRQRTQVTVLITLTLLVLVMFMVVGLVVAQNQGAIISYVGPIFGKSSTTEAPSSQPATKQTVSAISTATTTAQAAASMPAPSIVISPTLLVVTTAGAPSAVVNNTNVPLNNSTESILLTPTIAGAGYCVGEVAANHYIWAILSPFLENPQPPYFLCQLSAENSCQPTVVDQHQVHIGDLIIIPDVGKANCDPGKGGKWIPGVPAN